MSRTRALRRVRLRAALLAACALFWLAAGAPSAALQKPTAKAAAPGAGGGGAAQSAASAARSGGAPPAEEDQAAAPGAEVSRWDGTLADGLAELARRARSGDTEGALEVAEALLAPGEYERRRARASGFERRALDALAPLVRRLRWAGWSERVRAEIHYARGVALCEGERFVEAADAFDRARALAGPGELRRDATYDLGTAWLFEGERRRAAIPELGGATQGAPGAGAGGLPGPPGALGAPAGKGGAAPGGFGGAGAPAAADEDPIAVARRAFLRAREGLLERLRLDWRDADTRANLELVQRRLRELDELERRREEQRQEEQRKEKEQKSSEEQKPDQKGEQDRQQDEQQDGPKDEQQAESKPEENNSQEGSEQEESSAKPQEGEERFLTREEVQRLLDRLKQIEEEGEQMRAALRRAQRQRVNKDW